VPLKKLADDVSVFLRAGTFGLGFISEPRDFELMQFFALPKLLSQVFAEQSVNLKVLGDEVPRKCGEAGHS
jgi:hypothetical protein